MYRVQIWIIVFAMNRRIDYWVSIILPRKVLHLKKSIFCVVLYESENLSKFHPLPVMVIFLLEKLQTLDGFRVIILVSQFCLHILS